MKLTNAYVYIMSNKNATTYYIGVTNNLERRVKEHKNNLSEFTSRYKLHYLVYFEQFDNIENAICREKQLKGWKRNWKIKLIQEKNNNFSDLSSEW